ncbi:MULTISPECIES: acid-soluble spore protein N [Pontibacillus]|uniref:Small, acid-soluble spore protein N n=1 Tax=Pontibacillus salipaludis TaxID=1697394 RepID=A0ABQ1PJ14_9BACI|nr:MULTISPECIES: acid-soluble spore protein N [Pontibacillus]QST01691.1 acid-soluble spore protein N [Pontibacillus sp. ALD_SL1]GGC98075.1 small, acid-soluble spore protein N [Pontibacillus salipaludis]
MGNPKKDSKHFAPSHPGTQPREAGSNKGKQMQMQNAHKPKVIQTKGKK